MLWQELLKAEGNLYEYIKKFPSEFGLYNVMEAEGLLFFERGKLEGHLEYEDEALEGKFTIEDVKEKQQSFPKKVITSLKRLKIPSEYFNIPPSQTIKLWPSVTEISDEEMMAIHEGKVKDRLLPLYQYVIMAAEIDNIAVPPSIVKWAKSLQRQHKKDIYHATKRKLKPKSKEETVTLEQVRTRRKTTPITMFDVLKPESKYTLKLPKLQSAVKEFTMPTLPEASEKNVTHAKMILSVEDLLSKLNSVGSGPKPEDNPYILMFKEKWEPPLGYGDASQEDINALQKTFNNSKEGKAIRNIHSRFKHGQLEQTLRFARIISGEEEKEDIKGESQYFEEKLGVMVELKNKIARYIKEEYKDLKDEEKHILSLFLYDKELGYQQEEFSDTDKKKIISENENLIDDFEYADKEKLVKIFNIEIKKKLLSDVSGLDIAGPYSQAFHNTATNIKWESDDKTLPEKMSVPQKIGQEITLGEVEGRTKVTETIYHKDKIKEWLEKTQKVGVKSFDFEEYKLPKPTPKEIKEPKEIETQPAKEIEPKAYWSDAELEGIQAIKEIPNVEMGLAKVKRTLREKEPRAKAEKEPWKKKQKEARKELKELSTKLKELEKTIEDSELEEKDKEQAFTQARQEPSWYEKVYGIKKALNPNLKSLPPKKKKALKKTLQATEPTEYFGQDFTRLGDLIDMLKELDFIKADTKLKKKMVTLEEENLDMVATSARLRKTYESLYYQLRKIIYPKKSEGSLGEEEEE